MVEGSSSDLDKKKTDAIWNEKLVNKHLKGGNFNCNNL